VSSGEFADVGRLRRDDFWAFVIDIEPLEGPEPTWLFREVVMVSRLREKFDRDKRVGEHSNAAARTGSGAKRRC
jgi:hypothetical protein